MGEIVLPLPDLPPRDGGAPLPALYADDGRLILAYRPREGDGSIVVDFGSAWAHLFGQPNDEAFIGHALGRRWPKDAAFACEVLRSRWLADLRKRNRVHRCHSDAMFDNLRHLILPFNDATLEVATLSLRWSREPGRPRDSIACWLAPSG